MWFILVGALLLPAVAAKEPSDDLKLARAIVQRNEQRDDTAISDSVDALAVLRNAGLRREILRSILYRDKKAENAFAHALQDRIYRELRKIGDDAEHPDEVPDLDAIAALLDTLDAFWKERPGASVELYIRGIVMSTARLQPDVALHVIRVACGHPKAEKRTMQALEAAKIAEFFRCREHPEAAAEAQRIAVKTYISVVESLPVPPDESRYTTEIKAELGILLNCQLPWDCHLKVMSAIRRRWPEYAGEASEGSSKKGLKEQDVPEIAKAVLEDPSLFSEGLVIVERYEKTDALIAAIAEQIGQEGISAEKREWGEMILRLTNAGEAK